MSKTDKIYFITSLVLLIAMILGIATYFIFSNKDEEIGDSHKIAKEEKITDECVVEGEELEEASSTEEKISPNASFIIQKKYKECGHIVKEFVELPKEVVNTTQEEIDEKYPEFIVESFSAMEVVLYKEEAGYCKEHYLLKEKDGKIAIYRIDENESQSLLQTTEISIEYLPETDAINIKSGIKLYGKEALNAALEDYE